MKACGGDLHFEGPGWNSCTVDMIRVAKAHSMLVLHQTFVDAVDKLQRAVSSCTASCAEPQYKLCCFALCEVVVAVESPAAGCMWCLMFTFDSCRA